MARLPLLPEDDPAPGAPVDRVIAEGMFLSSDLRVASSLGDARQRRTTTRAYQIRARRRTTPQGVFAAIADLTVSDGQAKLAMGSRRCARSYPNPVWLHKVCDRALDNPQVLRRLIFTANNLADRRGDRLLVDRPGLDALSGPDRTSVRRTEAVAAILDVCRCGATWTDISDALAGRWPNLPPTVVDTAVRDLTRAGLLLTDLVPPDARDDPVGHVIGRLPDSEPLRDRLARLRAALADADGGQPGDPARLTALAQARQVCDDLTSTWRPVLVDTACDARVEVPASLADQAAQAAGVLWRLTPRGDPLAGWHERFLLRYGTHRLVPLLDVSDPVIGLGCDVGDEPPPPDGATTQTLARLLTDAISAGELEVRLDEATVHALDQRHSSDHPEPSAELYARVIAADPRARDAGNLALAVSGMASPAGSTRARFTGLLPQMLTGADAVGGPMTAELAFQPAAHAVAALTAPADLAPWRIPIGTAPRDGDLLPEELALASDGHRLVVWSTRHQRAVRPVHHNQLGHHLMPPLAALLCRLGQHHAVPLSPWRWGPLEHAPFLPRVRYSNVILSPARWNLPPALLKAATDPSEWEAALQQWRQGCRPPPPGIVLADDTDRQLPLNLNRDDDRDLLRRYTRRGLATVTEPPGGPDAVSAVVPGPTGHHALEVVIPLEATTPIHAPGPQTWPTARRGQQLGMFLPGGPWLSLAIQAPQATQDAVLARVAKVASDNTALWDRWFWLRYASDGLGEHIRVRFHGTPADLGGKLLPALNDCCGQLLADRLAGGLIVEPYEQEIERYGGPEAIESAEEVFYRDAELVLAVLASQPDPELRPATAAASAAAITRTVTHGDPAALTPYHLQRADRRTSARLRPLARAADDEVPHQDLWHARHRALATYRDTIPPSRRADCASSLIHMHANRLLGDNHTERIARALAKDLIARKPR